MTDTYDPNKPFVAKDGDADQELTLSDIADIAMDDIAEIRTVGFVRGNYKWRVVEMKLDTQDVKDKETDSTVARAVIAMKFQCIQVLSLLDKNADPEMFQGKMHTELQFVTNLKDAFGRMKALFVDMGLSGRGTLREMLVQSVDHEFYAPIMQRKNPNNTDQMFVNIDRSKIVPGNADLLMVQKKLGIRMAPSAGARG